MENIRVKTDNPLGYEKIPKLLAGFAIPSVVAMLVSSLYNIVDQIFIGQGVGYLGNAATNVAFPFTTICLAIALLIGIGSASSFSLSLGAGRSKEAAKYVGNAVLMMVTFGIIYAAMIWIFMNPLLKAFGATAEIMPYAQTYVKITAAGIPFLIINNGISCLARADGSPKYSMICMITGAVINTILDPIFIFKFNMGITGAAWATVIGQVVSCIMALFYLKKFNNIELTLKEFTFKPKRCARIATLGLSNSLNQIAITIVQIVLNNSLIYYGIRSVYGSEIPLAGCGIVMKVNSLLIAVFVGISQGTQPIVGFNYGAENYKRVRETYKLAIVCNLSISVIGFLAFQLFPRQIISVFGSGEPLYYEFSIKFMKIFLFMVLVNGVQVISSNFFSAIGKPLRGVFLSLTRQVLFLVPLILILPLFMGIDGILYSGPIADLIAFVISLIMIGVEFTVMKQKEKRQ